MPKSKSETQAGKTAPPPMSDGVAIHRPDGTVIFVPRDLVNFGPDGLPVMPPASQPSKMTPTAPGGGMYMQTPRGQNDRTGVRPGPTTLTVESPMPSIAIGGATNVHRLPQLPMAPIGIGGATDIQRLGPGIMPPAGVASMFPSAGGLYMDPARTPRTK